MRIDPDHVKMIASAIVNDASGSPEAKFDIEYMDTSMGRLSLWEQGLFIKALVRAVKARRRTAEQRALLALFLHREGDAS
jgi:hypothetical protein